MLLLLLNLLQQGRISRVVIVGAVLIFIAGVSLLVYFYRRYKRIETEPEEDWDHSRRSLFVNVAPPSQKIEEASDSAVVPIAPAPEIIPVPSGGTRELVSELHSQSPAPAATEPPQHVEAPAPPSPPIEAIQPAPPPPAPIEPQREERLTQVLASPSPVEPISKTEPEPEHAAFDEEVWAGLEVEEHSPAGGQAGETAPLSSVAQPPQMARVDERSHREPFEPPRIERVTHREPYEPPRIEPLTPREQAAATRELRSAAPPRTPAPRDEVKKTPARDTMIFGALPSDRGERPAEPMVAASARVAEPSLAGARSYKAPAGSILGLPAEASHAPLILGNPVRSGSETGIGALTNYGKDLSPKAGRGGTIALLIVVVLLGGSVLLYLLVPSVHSRVGAYVGRVRGTDNQAPMKPKAQIFPSFRQEGNKAKGAIDNISDEPLENLEVEVSLQHGGDATPEIRRGAVAPNPLPPNTRGTFEFEYDGKRDTGGKILRLLSNGSEIKFRAPNQQ